MHQIAYVAYFCAKDLPRAGVLLREFSKNRHGHAIITCDYSLNVGNLEAQLSLAFESHELLRIPDVPGDYGTAPQIAFDATMELAGQRAESIFWMEADIWPLHPHWREKIEEAYVAAGKPMVLMTSSCWPGAHPIDLTTGIAVYSNRFLGLWKQYRGDFKGVWDMFLHKIRKCSGVVETPLIHHYYNPFTDAAERDWYLGKVASEGAVIFHKMR